VLTLLPASIGGSDQTRNIAVAALALFLVLHLLIVLGEVGMTHATDNATYAAHWLVRGPCRNQFWIGAVGLGGFGPLLLLWVAPSNVAVAALSGALALAGLYAYEWCFVMAGQSVPNS